jgi:LysR family transcriptional activator of nhaA
MARSFSYRHLYYFWVVAKAGGMSRAAGQLGMAVQTISAQVRELEQSLGCALLKPAGRGIALTEAGVAAMHQAEQIFALGEALPDAVRSAADSAGLRLAVGIPDGLPKLAVHRLLGPVLQEPGLRLVCHDGEFEDLLGDLALHKLDLVISDRPAPSNPSLRLYGHGLGGSTIAWYAAADLAARLDGGPAPRRTAGAARAAAAGRPRARPGVRAQAALLGALADGQLPVLLPTGHGVLRARLDHWFERHGLRPRVAGEFEDSAMLKTFGAGGMGIFPAATLVEAELVSRYGVQRVGDCDGVEEHFFAITPQKRVEHRLVRQITEARLLP